MPFCTKCGNELSSGASFCGKCGKEQLAVQNMCSKCGKELEVHEKFCSGCGTPTASNVEPKPGSKKQPEPETKKEEKFTKEGRKIISGGPKPEQNNQSTPQPPQPSGLPTKKKNKGCRGCAITTVIILAGLIVVTMLVYNRISDWWQDYKTEQGIETLDAEGVDGIVDIEEGDVSHLPENRKGEAEILKSKPIVEGKDIKKAAKLVEDAFVKSDITALKLLLSESAKKRYSGALNEIQPHMKNYANAFKNRKLVTSTDICKMYEFKDTKGQVYTVAFELQPDGEWKLTRF